VPGLVSASADSAWSYGGAILTFVFPMILFIAVAVALYVLYTKPQMVPGHRGARNERSVAATLTAGPAAAGPAAATGEGHAAEAEGK
jgi:hypothetical protein